MAAESLLSDEELDRNFEALKKALPVLLPAHRGKFAIVRNGEVGDICDTVAEAHGAGWRLYGDDRFSVQEVTDEPVYLGIFSHADHHGTS